MSHADPDIVQPQSPDPHRAGSARLEANGVGKILHLLRTLVAYGRNVVTKLREEDDPHDLPWYAFLTALFGSTDPALITVVFIRGLLRARALKARLSLSRARGHNTLLSLPIRDSGRVRAPASAQPRAAGAVLPPGYSSEDPSHDREPSPEEEMYAEIAAEDRDRPVGAILFDICFDLGIVPALMDPTTWDELRLAITLYGGDPAPLLSGDVNAMNTPSPHDSPTIPVAGTAYPPWPAPPDQPPPSWEDRCREADSWVTGPGQPPPRRTEGRAGTTWPRSIARALEAVRLEPAHQRRPFVQLMRDGPPERGGSGIIAGPLLGGLLLSLG